MLLSYLKLSLRLLARNPLFTFINVAGLSIGFAVFFILWQFSQSELNSDRQWKDWERIARLGFSWEWTDDGRTWEIEIKGANVTHFAPILVADYPELETFTRYIPQSQFRPAFTGLPNQIIVAVEEPSQPRRLFREEHMICADANIFDFFSITLLEGNSKTSLLKSNSVVLSHSTAKKYFGQYEATGKILLINGIAYEVTGVFEDLPHNTHMNFELVISNQAKLDFWAVPRTMPICNVYLKRNEAIKWSGFESKLNQPAIIQKYFDYALRIFPNGKLKNILQPVDETAFSKRDTYQEVLKSKPMLLAFQFIGVVVLALAIINYTNLNAARTASRLKEIATRKVSGAGSRDFYLQFTMETMLVMVIAIALAFTILQLSKSPFQLLLQIPVQRVDVNSLIIFTFVVLVSVTVCGAYPALMSRSYHPRTLLSISSRSGRQKSIFILFQYGTAIILIVCGFMIYLQITFILKKELGFEKSQTIIINTPIVRGENYEVAMQTFRDRIGHHTDVISTTTSTTIMGDDPGLITVRRPGINNPVVLDSNGGVDENFVPFYGLTLAAGRNFIPEEKGNVIIISEGALIRLGFSDASSAVGNRIDVFSGEVLGREGVWQNTEIIGVVKGYRLRPFFVYGKYGNEYDKEDRGIAITYKSALVPSLGPETISVRLDMGDLTGKIERINKIYSELFPGNALQWKFLDDNINKHYASEKTWRNQILFFTCLAIGIACLGLLGMISNKVVEKTKEIGIRKVLGAQLYQIAQLLLNTTVKQIIIATVTGIPVAYYLTQQYLQKFSERIELQWWHFALPVLILMVIMFFTIASVLWKAASSNPVEALRAE